jgi:hypothetical protein
MIQDRITSLILGLVDFVIKKDFNLDGVGARLNLGGEVCFGSGILNHWHGLITIVTKVFGVAN